MTLTDETVREVVTALTEAADHVATAITVVAAPGEDAGGGSISCLTEAVMGVTGGLFAIAEALNAIAEKMPYPPE